VSPGKSHAGKAAAREAPSSSRRRGGREGAREADTGGGRGGHGRADLHGERGDAEGPVGESDGDALGDARAGEEIGRLGEAGARDRHDAAGREAEPEGERGVGRPPLSFRW
jgi:hypothetical protein